ncbi:hypothetical protein JL721_4180 [Aureococcus anophagefferens]|nr:hypothetical protein JL721_4180 [Aureococcus anophagefferens]
MRVVTLAMLAASARAWSGLARRGRASTARFSAVADAVSTRPSAAGVSLELRTLKDHADTVKAHVRARQGSEETVDSVDRMVALTEQRAAAQRERDAALSAEGAAEVAASADVAEGAEATMAALEEEANALFAALRICSATAPGGGRNGKRRRRRVGTDSRKLGDEGDYLWHDDLAAGLGGFGAEASSLERACGARGVARLERALGAFFLDMHTDGGGYEEVSSPVIVARSALEGGAIAVRSDLFKLDNHKVRGEDAFLIPTAEVPLTNLVAGDILDESDLPIRHQFAKVELVKIVAPDDGVAEHEALVADAEKCLQLLDLPYRKEYREISSCSLMGDYQARRMGLRFRPKPAKDENDGGKKKKGKPKPLFPYTMNGSGLARSARMGGAEASSRRRQ